MPTLRSRRCKTSWVCSGLIYRASAIVATDWGLWRKSLIRCRSSSVNSHTSRGSPIALSFVLGHCLGRISVGHHRLWQEVCRAAPRRKTRPGSAHAGKLAGKRAIRGKQNLPTTVRSADAHSYVAMLPRYGWYSTRDECLGTAGDHRGQSWRWRVWRRCRMCSRGPVKKLYARVRWGEGGEADS
jgi:hypothetical protein